MTFSSLLSEFFTSCFTLFSKHKYAKLYKVCHGRREVPAHSFHLNPLPGLTVHFFFSSGVGIEGCVMIFLLPFSLGFLEHFGNVEHHLKIHIDWINYVTIRTGSVLPVCLFTSSKELKIHLWGTICLSKSNVSTF